MQVSKVIKQHGFTQAQVAEKIGMQHSSLRYLIANKGGKEAPLTLASMRKIAGAIGCSVGEFFDDERTLSREYNGKQPVLDIRAVMKAKGVKNKDLAERMGITTQNACLMLSKDSMTLARLYKVAEALDVPITDLFSYKE